jgi:hypothetical protein
MDQPKNVAENLFVIGILLEPDQLDVDGIEVFARFRQKLAQKIVHDKLYSRNIGYVGECRLDGFMIG